MKKFLCLFLAVVMVVGMLAGCGDNTESSTEIVIGTSGPYTGSTAEYGEAVRDGIALYVKQLNEKGGINGKTVKLISYDNEGDDAKATTAFNRLVSDGIVAYIGDVLTSNTLAVVAESYPINMPQITASATADSVTYDSESNTLYSNVFRTCFIDSFQGIKMAQFAAQKLNAKTAAVIYQSGSDYAEGVANAFIEECKNQGITVIDPQSYSEGDKNFGAQLTYIGSKNPDVIFCPNYYEDDGNIVKQARQKGITATFLGSDGWGGVSGYASADELEGSYYCSGYAAGSTDAVKEFEAAFKAEYGKDVPNMFAALAYDAAMVMCNAISVAEQSGKEYGSDEYKQAIIDAIKNNSSSVVGVTSATGYTYDSKNNPIKEAVIIKVTGGKEVFDQTF